MLSGPQSHPQPAHQTLWVAPSALHFLSCVVPAAIAKWNERARKGGTGVGEDKANFFTASNECQKVGETDASDEGDIKTETSRVDLQVKKVENNIPSAVLWVPIGAVQSEYGSWSRVLLRGWSRHWSAACRHPEKSNMLLKLSLNNFSPLGKTYITVRIFVWTLLQQFLHVKPNISPVKIILKHGFTLRAIFWLLMPSSRGWNLSASRFSASSVMDSKTRSWLKKRKTIM